MSLDMSLAANWIIIFFGTVTALIIVSLVWMYLHDRFQTTHAVLRNFPVIGRMRYRMERLGEYFRQYFFAHDREEQPFNRATRAWIYRTAKGLGGLVAFGSTNDLREPGSVIFVNASFPLLDEECTEMPAITLGPDCDQPFMVSNVFHLSGMSYGAISKPAVRALSRGAAQAGIWMNTGEGGLSPYHLEGGGDLIYQIGTAKYGVRDAQGLLDDHRLRELAKVVKAFEIKLSQGAKPGRGGVLPAKKVTLEVAAIRGIPVGQTSSSPNRHPDIGSVAELLDVIARIRQVTGRPVGFKAVMGSERFMQELCDEVLKRGLDSAPDFITVDGGEGGTGAAPQVLIDHVGMPLTESLPMVVDALCRAGLRHRIRVIASGKMVTSANVAWAMCMGADFAVSARGFMFALGCIQSLQCHLDTCPTGITTHNKRLQKGLVVKDKAQRVATYAHWVNHEVNVIAHACGLHNAREFSREHARIVRYAGVSQPLHELYPG
ncbi:MAG: FMN-binding glutamate synthase family protein [Gammaproteobacteria bacterium]